MSLRAKNNAGTGDRKRWDVRHAQTEWSGKASLRNPRQVRSKPHGYLEEEQPGTENKAMQRPWGRDVWHGQGKQGGSVPRTGESMREREREKQKRPEMLTAVPGLGVWGAYILYTCEDRLLF